VAREDWIEDDDEELEMGVSAKGLTDRLVVNEIFVIVLVTPQHHRR
jgi:hypothetical protein